MTSEQGKNITEKYETLWDNFSIISDKKNNENKNAKQKVYSNFEMSKDEKIYFFLLLLHLSLFKSQNL